MSKYLYYSTLTVCSLIQQNPIKWYTLTKWYCHCLKFKPYNVFTELVAQLHATLIHITQDYSTRTQGFVVHPTSRG